jgi:hypothetical protein
MLSKIDNNASDAYHKSAFSVVYQWVFDNAESKSPTEAGLFCLFGSLVGC